MKKGNSFLTLFGLFTFLEATLPLRAHARPEYATREKQDCTACHVVPWGGGPRMIFGKTYGSHSYVPAKTSQLDVFYGDLRMIAYYPVDRTTQRMNGIALMQASATANVPIVPSQDAGSGAPELRGVLTYNIAPLSGSHLREGFIRWQSATGEGKSPYHLVLGHFYAPFGLLTDEHRTYTRLQTGLTINTYHVGLGVSGNPLRPLHFDWVLVNDFNTGGTFTTRDLTWASVLNLRWNPESLPFLLGASANLERTTLYRNPFATSLYTVISLDRLTKNALSGSFSFERVDAKNWNNPAVNSGQINVGYPDFFIPSDQSAFQSSLIESRSLGYYFLAKHNLSPRWTLFYKLDYLDLDRRSAADDSYYRHGFGIEGYLSSNIILNLRYEFANVGNTEIARSDVLAAHHDFFALLRLWL